MTTSIWDQIRNYVGPEDITPKLRTNHNINVCVKVGIQYRECFFNEYVILQNGTIAIWAHSHTGLLKKKCFFYTTWEYYTYVYHFITSSQGTQLTHQFWDFIQMDNDDPIGFDPVGIRVFTYLHKFL